MLIPGLLGGSVAKNLPWQGATEPMSYDCWACVLSPGAPDQACASQQEKPPEWETHTVQPRVDPARRN